MAAYASIATGNWSNPAIWWSDDPTPTYPGDGDDVRINGHTVTIDTDLGSVNGGGIKQIILQHASAKLQIDSSAGRKIVFASTGSDPTGTGGTKTNPNWATVTMFGFFVAKGLLFLQGSAAHPATITTADGVSSWYMISEWGCCTYAATGAYGTGTPAYNYSVNATLSYLIMERLGMNKDGFYGIYLQNRTGGSGVATITHNRFVNPYVAWYITGPVTQASQFSYNTISGKRGSKTITITGQYSGLTVEHNTETNSTFTSGMNILLHSLFRPTVGNIFRRNVVVGTQSCKAGLYMCNANFGGTPVDNISYNVLLNYQGSPVITEGGISPQMGGGVVSYNVLEGAAKSLNLISPAGFGTVTNNWAREYSDSSYYQGVVFSNNSGGTGLYVTNNILIYHNPINYQMGAFFYNVNVKNTIFNNNTIVHTGTNPGPDTSAIVLGEGGYPVNGVECRNNLIAGPNATGRGIIDGASDNTNLIVGYNCTTNCNVDYHKYGSTWSPTFGLHPDSTDLVDVDPLFFDTSRIPTAWDTAMGGDGTLANIGVEFSKRSGLYGESTTYTTDAMYAWLTDGWTPQQPLLTTSGYNGGQIGAVAPVPDTTAPVVTFSVTPPAAGQLVASVTCIASDASGIAGYKITQSDVPPTSWDLPPAPTSYSVGTWGTYTLYAWAKDFAGNVSSPATATVTFTQAADTAPPTVTAFTIGTPSELSVTTNITATDNVGVTGYAVTESTAQPSSGWQTTGTFVYTSGSAGTKTLYPWARDAAGNISPLSGITRSATFSATDTTPPTVTAFTLPGTATSLTIDVTAFTATDDTGVVGYLINESSSTPALNDPGWTASAPTTVTASRAGTVTFYGWARDAAGNIGVGTPATVVITLADTTDPTITSLTAPAAATIPIPGPVAVSLTATDNTLISQYLLSDILSPGETVTAETPGWVAVTPPTGSISVTTPHTFTQAGSRTLTAWVMDSAGNISLPASTAIVITQLATNVDTQAVVDAILNTPLAEIYPPDGTEPTLRQALYVLLALASEKSITGTTMTVNRLDGTTPAMTFELNSATNPTSITRTA